MSVASNGFAIIESRNYPGSNADILIFREELETHKIQIRKADEDDSLNIDGRETNVSSFWGILLVEDYTGIQRN